MNRESSLPSARCRVLAVLVGVLFLSGCGLVGGGDGGNGNAVDQGPETPSGTPTRGPLTDEVVADPTGDLSDDSNLSADATVQPSSVDIDSVGAYEDSSTGELHVSVQMADVVASRVKNGQRTSQSATVFIGYGPEQSQFAFETNLVTAERVTMTNTNDEESSVPADLRVSKACEQVYPSISGRFNVTSDVFEFIIPAACVDRDMVYVSAASLAQTNPVREGGGEFDALGGDATQAGLVTFVR